MRVYAGIILSFCFALAAKSQDHSLSGTVKDASNGETLAGSTVLLKGTTRAAATNAYGFYSLSAPAGTYTMRVFAGAYPDDVRSADSFTFEKLPGQRTAAPGADGGWSLSGWEVPPVVLEEVAAHLVIDVRRIDRFAAGHLPGSVSIELRPQFGTWLGWLVEPGRPLVVVLDSDQDREDLVRQCLDVGHEHLVGELDGGVEAWIATGRPAATTPFVDVGDIAPVRSLAGAPAAGRGRRTHGPPSRSTRATAAARDGSGTVSKW